jgi:hypothetical protein
MQFLQSLPALNATKTSTPDRPVSGEKPTRTAFGSGRASVNPNAAPSRVSRQHLSRLSRSDDLRQASVLDDAIYAVMGPDPFRALDCLVDLGLSDREIADYVGVSLVRIKWLLRRRQNG